jgi:hypothetical protein
VLKEIEKRLEGLENHRRWIEEWQRRWGRIELLPLWPSTAPPEVWIHDKRPDDTPPQWSPNIVGKVLKVTGDGEVEISLGSDNGLAPGHRVDIYRPVAGTLSYVGRVQATEVTHERAVGKILPEFGTSAICIGDGVATLRR